MLSKAVFLDKDGTLIENVPYNVDPQLIRLSPGASEGLRMLQAAGYELLVVSNQSGIARGLFSEDALVTVEQRLHQLLSAVGVSLDGFYFCPHHPHGIVPEYAHHCDCRKPSPGLLHKAAGEHQVSLASSWLVGDILDDIEAGNRAGCRTILIDNGNETEWHLSSRRRPDFIVKDLFLAAYLITALPTLKPRSPVLEPSLSGG